MPKLLTTNGSIDPPLGRWISQPHQKWRWYYSLEEDNIYKKTTDGWTQYSAITHRTRQDKRFSFNGTIAAPPPNLCRTTVTQINDSIIKDEGYDRHTPQEEEGGEHNLQTSDSWLLQNVTEQNLNQPEWIIEGLAQGKMTAVCDGSYQPALSENWVSAAWRIETQPRQYICGKATVAGHVADAYRGELLGIYGILTLIKQIEQMHPTYAK